jgi:hypothetical protein
MITKSGRSQRMRLHKAAGWFSLLSAAACAVSVVAARSASAAPVEWTVASGGNGHWYEAVFSSDALNWNEARAAAEGAGGYLATATSDAENSFLFNLSDNPVYWVVGAFNDGIGPWLGGRQKLGADEPAGGWSWVSGEPFVYANWDTGQPNNFTFQDYPTEDSLHFYATDAANNPRTPKWNDLWGEIKVKAYLVEWNTNPIPEPATYLQLAAGMGLLWLFAVRTRRSALRQKSLRTRGG